MSKFAGRVCLRCPRSFPCCCEQGGVTLWKSKCVWDQPLWTSRHDTACLQRPGHLLTDGTQLGKILPRVSPHVCCHPKELHPAGMLDSGFSKASCPSTQKALVISLQQVPLSRPHVFSYPLSTQNQSQSHVWSSLVALSTIKFSMPFAKSFPPFLPLFNLSAPFFPAALMSQLGLAREQ